MRERKLSMLLLPVIVWFLIMGVWHEWESSKLSHPWQEGDYIYAAGTIYQTGHTKTATTVYLKNISIYSSPDASLSESTYDEIYKKSNILVYLKEDSEFFIGDRVLITGVCSYPQGSANPGGFDALSYYGSKNIYLILKKAIIKERVIQKSHIREFFRNIQEKITDVIDASASDTDAQILKSLLLGDRSDMDEEVKELYQDNGIIHVLAISGLHISMIGMSLFHFLRRCHISYPVSACFSFSLILMYGFLTGFPVSAVRAIFMFAVYLGAQVGGRSVDMITSMCMAAVFMLIRNPRLITQSGFLLSFGAVCGVLATQLLPFRWLNRSSLGVSFSAWLITLPISAYFFFQVSVGGIFLNLIVVPSMSVIVAFGILGTIMGFFSPLLAVFVLAPVHYLLSFTLFLCSKIRLLPGMLLITGRPSFLRILTFYFILYVSLYLYRKRVSVRAKICKLSGIILAAVLLLVPLKGAWSVTFLNVGQGDGICIHTDQNHIYMIDGGSSSEYSPGTNILEPYLKCTKASLVNAWFVSHYDSDHVNGLIEILEDYHKNLAGQNISGVTIRRIILPNLADEADGGEELKIKILELAAKHQIPVSYAARGDTIDDQGTMFEVVGPIAGTSYTDSNAGSMVLKVSYEQFSMLLTGDVQGTGESDLLHARLGEIDVLKVAHHGSKNSSSMEILKHINPKAAVISCGKNNRYGHPNREVLANLKELSVTVRRTDLEGPVRFVVRKQGFYDKIRERF